MTENDQKNDAPKDDNVHFDMYHFFSRKTVIFAVILILFLLFCGLWGMLKPAVA